MTNERLTRQELSWLLAQEARGAAKALRDGVTQLTQPPPPGIVVKSSDGEVSTSLDALDEAITRLGELQLGAQATKARRGRIDLAALLCEVAPNANISMEPGAGTEVFGEEGELRRMLHLLIGQTNSAPSPSSQGSSSSVEIRRQAEWVKLSVELGPDASPTAELERRWLARMATRHGGRLELEGGVQTMWLPADGAGDEVNELRRELEQAQQLGEVYARELAQVVSSGAMPSSPPPPAEATSSAAPLGTLIAVAAVLERNVRGWLEGARQEQPPAAERGAARSGAMHEFAQELERIAACPVTEEPSACDVATVVGDAIETLAPRAARFGVRLETALPGSLPSTVAPRTLALAVLGMLQQAILASPRGSTVRITLSEQLPLKLVVSDGGPSVPEPLRDELLRRALDPSSVGRPDGLGLLAANAAAGAVGGHVRFEDDGAEMVLVLRVP